MNDDAENQENKGEPSAQTPTEAHTNAPGTSVAPAPPAVSPSEKEERNWALFAHISTLSTFVGIPGFIGPLVVWLVKKDELPFAAAQAKEALNFQISLFIYSIICVILILTVIGALIGFPGLIVLVILEIVFTIIASVQAGEGKPYRYPMTLRLIE